MKGAELVIILTDDWELRGDGSGHVDDLQRKPALRLMTLYENHGVRGTFNVEVMQQLAFERFADRNPEIARQRDLWKETVTDFVARGFDVQLHVHPQWYGADFDGSTWSIGSRWHIVDYGREQIGEIVESCFSYLSCLIAPQKITAFRGGSWGMGPPSRNVLEALLEHGIHVDMSIVNGVDYRGDAITLDYTELDSPYEPYYPDMDDIRRVSTTQRLLIEVPTQSVALSEIRSSTFKLVWLADRITLERIRRLVIGRIAPKLRSWAGAARRNGQRHGLTARQSNRVKDPFGFVSGRSHTDFILDISLNHRLFQFKQLVDVAIERAIQTDRIGPHVLVFENHTKDLQSDMSFKRIDGLLQHIKDRYPGTRFLTMSDAFEVLSARAQQC
jgi:hypothetical protein